MRKEVRKAKANGVFKKIAKQDNRIPNLYPYKAQLLNALERQNDANNNAEKLKSKDNEQHESMEEYMEQVNQKVTKYERSMTEEEKENAQDLDLNKGMDMSRKAYMRDLKHVIDEADVILQVLDARDPMGCRNPEMENLIISGNKKLVLILNKIDLIPQDNARTWLKILRDQHPTVLFKATTQNQKENLSAKISLHKKSLNNQKELVDSMLQSSKGIGSDNLLQLLKNYARLDGEKKSKKQIIVGVIGFPNVGKSSLINTLKRSKAAAIGNTPGMTKSIQEIHLDKDIVLLDSPGVVLTKENTDSLILRNVIKLEDLKDPIRPIELLLSKVDHVKLMKLYRISEFEGTTDFLSQVGLKRGKLNKGGVANFDATARIVLRDFNNGKIHFYTEPGGELLENLASDSDDEEDMED